MQIKTPVQTVNMPNYGQDQLGSTQAFDMLSGKSIPISMQKNFAISVKVPDFMTKKLSRGQPRLEWKIDRENNFTVVVTTLIDAIFRALYTVMAPQNILRIRLKKDQLLLRNLLIITNFYAYIRDRIFLRFFVIFG